MELGRLKQLCQLHPMVDIVETVRLVLRVAPKAWRLMSAALISSQISQQASNSDSYKSTNNLHICTKALRMSDLRGLSEPAAIAFSDILTCGFRLEILCDLRKVLYSTSILCGKLQVLEEGEKFYEHNVIGGAACNLYEKINEHTIIACFSCPSFTL